MEGSASQSARPATRPVLPDVDAMVAGARPSEEFIPDFPPVAVWYTAPRMRLLSPDGRPILPRRVFHPAQALTDYVASEAALHATLPMHRRFAEDYWVRRAATLLNHLHAGSAAPSAAPRRAAPAEIIDIADSDSDDVVDVSDVDDIEDIEDEDDEKM